MNHILVTGATGTVGRHLTGLLSDRGVRLRALVRDPDRARELLGPDVELAVGDFGDPPSLRAAMDGVERVFLTCANHPMQVAWENAAIDTAVEAGVRLVVKQSALGAALGSPVPFLAAHARIEEHLMASGLPHVLLRPSFKMTNLLAGADAVRQTATLFLPGAGAAIAMIDPRDVAEVAGLVLLAPDVTAGEAYELTGPEVVTFDDVAERLSAVTGRSVSFAPVPDEAAREQLIAAGADPWFADGAIAQFGLLRRGDQAAVRDTVQRLLGRPPRSIAEFLGEVAGAFGDLTD